MIFFGAGTVCGRAAGLLISALRLAESFDMVGELYYRSGCKGEVGVQCEAERRTSASEVNPEPVQKIQINTKNTVFRDSLLGHA